MKSINLILVFVGLLGGAVAAAEKPTATKPNIIYLLSDDLGYGDIGFNGCKDIRTANLGKLEQRPNHSCCLASAVGFEPVLAGYFQDLL